MRPSLSCCLSSSLDSVCWYFHTYIDYECAWSLLGGAGVLASPFQAMHGLASPLTAAYGSAPVGGKHHQKQNSPNVSSYPLQLFDFWIVFYFVAIFNYYVVSSIVAFYLASFSSFLFINWCFKLLCNWSITSFLLRCCRWRSWFHPP